MCGRFIMIPKDELNKIIAEVKKNLKAEAQANVSATYSDVYPKAEVPVIVPHDSGLEAEAMMWGYPVSWQKDVVFNTRADTAMDTSGKRNMWKDSLEKRRCIIPSYGFYEPHKSETFPSPKTGKPIKRQYRFNLQGSPIVFMAGIYEDDHFSIMTTEPNHWMEPIHKRMPVVLLPDELNTWLHGDYTSVFDRSGIELLSEAA